MLPLLYLWLSSKPCGVMFNLLKIRDSTQPECSHSSWKLCLITRITVTLHILHLSSSKADEIMFSRSILYNLNIFLISLFHELILQLSLFWEIVKFSSFCKKNFSIRYRLSHIYPNLDHWILVISRLHDSPKKTWSFFVKVAHNTGVFYSVKLSTKIREKFDMFK